MRIIVTGGREYTNREHVRRVLIEYPGAIVIQGGARGTDTLAAEEARKLGYPVETYRANWEKYGKVAGFKRNERMAEDGADECIAFPGGNGTRHMIHIAIQHEIPVRRES